jgi:hypothetical protein
MYQWYSFEQQRLLADKEKEAMSTMVGRIEWLLYEKEEEKEEALSWWAEGAAAA